MNDNVTTKLFIFLFFLYTYYLLLFFSTFLILSSLFLLYIPIIPFYFSFLLLSSLRISLILPLTSFHFLYLLLYSFFPSFQKGVPNSFLKSSFFSSSHIPCFLILLSLCLLSSYFPLFTLSLVDSLSLLPLLSLIFLSFL